MSNPDLQQNADHHSMRVAKPGERVAEGERPPGGGLAAVLILLVILAGALLVVLDWGRFGPVLAQADARPLAAALALTLVSYASTSTAFALVSRLLGIRMSKLELAQTGFVTIVLNHVIAAAGVAGYSVRYLLMRRHGVALKDVLAASILHFYLTSLDMLLMLPVGLLYLLLNASVTAGVTTLIGVVTLVMALVALAATGLIFLQTWRSRMSRVITHLGLALLRRDWGETLQRFDHTLGRGVKAMRRQPSTLMLVVALTWVDWFASLGVVWLCFDALGEPLSLGVTLSGYVIGIMAGVLSMVPGGLGVQEGSMTGVFVLLGAPFQQALLAAILFRGVYFLLPYGISLVFYRRLLR
jgi:uncharacterized protein (TIRG00374 family)